MNFLNSNLINFISLLQKASSDPVDIRLKFKFLVCYTFIIYFFAFSPRQSPLPPPPPTPYPHPYGSWLSFPSWQKNPSSGKSTLNLQIGLRASLLNLHITPLHSFNLSIVICPHVFLLLYIVCSPRVWTLSISSPKL